MLETVYTPLHAACDRYICMSVQELEAWRSYINNIVLV